MQRRRALESRKINNIDVLDHPVGALGDSSEGEDNYDLDEIINALNQVKKAKKTKSLKINMITEEMINRQIHFLSFSAKSNIWW